jgi:hypothetical protein
MSAPKDWNESKTQFRSALMNENLSGVRRICHSASLCFNSKQRRAGRIDLQRANCSHLMISALMCSKKHTSGQVLQRRDRSNSPVPVRLAMRASPSPSDPPGPVPISGGTFRLYSQVEDPAARPTQLPAKLQLLIDLEGFATMIERNK